MNSLSEILLSEPWPFLRNWYHNVRAVPELGLVPFPLSLFCFAGLLFSFRFARPRNSVLLLSLCLISFWVAVAIAFTQSRLFLFLGMIFAIFSAFGLTAFFPRRLSFGRAYSVSLRIPGIILLSAWLCWTYILPMIMSPLSDYDLNRMKVSSTISGQGAKAATEVLAFSFDYYDMTKPTKDRFQMPWYKTEFEPYDSVGDISKRMKVDGQRFFVFDQNAPNNVRDLRKIWPLSEKELAQYFDRIAVFSDSVYVYRLRATAISSEMVH